MFRLLFVLFTPFMIIGCLLVYEVFLKSPPPLPEYDLETWWGPPDLKDKQDNSIRPFRVAFSEEMLADLKIRLQTHRNFTPPLQNIGFEYGFNSAALSSWLQYWHDKYLFKERENWINQFPQFKTNIQGLDIHFIRVKPKVSSNVEVVPLLLVHGWPSSVMDFYQIIPLLSGHDKERDFVVEVIVPSLPGYGFSDNAVRPGLNVFEVAIIFKNLMLRLGYSKFFVHGGDWGAFIIRILATVFPQDILGLHSTMPVILTPVATYLTILGTVYPPLIADASVTDRMYPLSKHYSFWLEETGYLHLQASKPDTIGVALTDSPAGLLAYILEKFSTGTNRNNRLLKDGGLDTRFTRDQLLDNVMIYWISNCITSSMRLYAETINKKFLSYRLDEIPISVPTWVVQAKYELGYQPAHLLRLLYTNLLHETILDDGGHFLAMEFPKVLAEDLLTALQQFRKWHRKNKVKKEL